MNEEVSRYWGLTMIILQLFLLLLCLNDCQCKPLNYLRGSASSTERRLNVFLPLISPDTAPQPFLPLLAPSPLAPLTNATIPKLSGLCMFNFLAIQSLMSTTSTDCHAFFAPLLANFICCPQLEATLAILVGQSSKVTNALALNGTVSKYCLSDIEHILVGLGAENNLGEICSMHPSNLTEGSCPVTDINEFESLVESSKLLHACEKIDPVNECCEQVCQSAILEAANRLALKASKVLSIESSNSLPRHSNRVSDCKHVVLRWLASKLDPSHAKEVLRGLSNCNVNKADVIDLCFFSYHFSFLSLRLSPVFLEMRHVLKSCGNIISNKEECCNSMESYISHLQKQSLITNLQALDCATTLGMKLQKSNITMDVYSLCHVTLKDFSLQFAKQESGCLLPSLPSDATLDKYTGISFICDLNDNIPASWPSSSQLSASSCNKTVRIPELPSAVTSAQNGLYHEDAITNLVAITLLVWLSW
ncbi:hypothetical protein K2173_001202 [Erythroxylum novogranatense]|uniref:SPARK domain-containing protein n=1 Tax=Erythroxylum novogranatense TaxID=1862640 RepID=A0AAV8T446_9ROSI|nr:hypothetical protein K2173_001202 [Erythroxylum novogranatense]